jgi:diguanylate cyclase (GGDEF)-like protein
VTGRASALPFLLKFGAACLVPVAVVAIGVTRFVSDEVRSQALDAHRQAAALAASSIQSGLAPYDLDNGLSPAAFVSVDRLLVGLKNAGIEHVVIWSAKGRVVYSDRREEVGRRPGTLERLNVDRTRLTSRLVRSEARGPRGDLFHVFVPLRFEQSASAGGTLQLSIPYGPIRDGIASTTGLINLFLVVGLGLLYAMLFPIAYNMSRRLREQVRENRHLALHDPLTGLPNRVLFRERAGQAIRRARREGSGTTVLLMDLDRFKEVNDTLGHESGDIVLEELAGRLRGVLRETDTLARLGGDEFAIVLPDTGTDSFQFVLERIAAALEAPCMVGGLPLQVETSIGIACYPDHASDVETLLRNADIAMYVAKQAHSPYAVYSPGEDEHSSDRVALIAELRHAIAAGELDVLYQPKVDLRDGSPRGVEVLVRWRHPRRGLLGPMEFIPLAQHTSLIDPLTHYVLRSALAQARRWHDQGLGVSVAVNIATRTLINPAFPVSVRALLDEFRLPPSALELEITESSVFSDPRRAGATLEALAAIGVGLAIDDFGTGYSSLSHLVQLPVSQIKIDRSFVSAMTHDRQCAAIVRSTIELARNLSLETVAEGVESAETMRLLAELGCDMAQGFFLSRPLSSADASAWLARAAQGRLRATA